MLILIDIFEKNEVGSSKHNNIRKSRSKLVEISAVSKSKNMSKSRFKNLFKFNKIQNTSTIKELYFLTLNTRLVLTKLKEVFI